MLVIKNTGLQIAENFQEPWRSRQFPRPGNARAGIVAGHEKQVVATGGGIILRESNTALLKKLGFVVWLRTSEERIFERVSRNKKRPLVQTANPRETIHNLLTQRTPLYTAAAEFIIDTCDKTHAEVAEAIILEAQRGI